MSFKHLLVLSVSVFFLLFSGTSTAQNYTVINDASSYSGCNCYRLTPAVNNQGGGVYQNNTINLNNSFDYTFNVFLGCNGSGGADGIVFILTNNITGIGAQGGGLGYSGLSGNSFAVEYDTWQNSQDPSYDHIAFEAGGSVNHNVAGPVPALASQAMIDDCNWHTTEIIWNVNTQTYSVYFDGTLRLTYTGNIVNNFFGGNPIVNWGWSGSTGGGNNDQRFCVTQTSSWTAGTNYQSCNPTMQFRDISTTNVGSVQSWAWNFGDPGSGASNTSTLQNPSHTFSTTGTFTVSLTITDVTGCTNTYSHIVTINPPISLSATPQSPTCNGAANGNIPTTITGGFGAAAGYGGYQYIWSNGAQTSGEVGVTAGTYTVTVNDGVCSATASYTLTQPAALTATTSHTDASCGSNNGSVSMTITGGTQPYTGVNWNLVPASGSGNGPYVRNNVPAAIYVADFHDANGCSALLTYRETVNSLPCGYNISTSSTNVNCYGQSTGSVTVTVTGGTGPSIYWTNSGGTNVGSGATLSNLPAGAYTYHYSDANGQNFTGTVTVNQPGAAMVATLATTNATCSYLNNGSAVASVTANGNSPYSYAWSASGQGNSPSASNLSQGAISVVITDNLGCTATASGTISGQPAIVPGTVTTTSTSCRGDSTGSAVVSPSGGVSPYTYLWNNSPTAIGAGDYGIPAGTYTVTVTDHNGCTAQASGTVGQPAAAFTVTPAHTDVACFGNTTGTITLTQAGGTPAYATPLWLDGPTGTTRSNLAAGTYYFADSDSHGCLVIDSIKILQPSSAFTVTAAHTNVNCFGAATGTITLTETGGTTPYGAVTWSGGLSGTNPINVAAGTYNYTVTDANSCQQTGSVTVTQPASAFTVTAAHTNVNCFGASTGTITLTETGGTTPYSAVTWSGGLSGTNPINVAAGTYNYTVTDANSCQQTGSVTVTQPAAAFTVTATHTDVNCFGAATGTITLTEAGGTTPYGAVTWSGGLSGTNPINVAAGTYNYTVSDANSCQQTGSVTVTQPASAFTVTAAHTNVNCFGAATGTITLTETGGTTPYGAVTWSGGLSGTNPINVAAGTYNYTVTDANSCQQTGSVTVTQPASAFTVTAAHTNVNCFGAATGTITLTETGGTTPYSAVTWSGGLSGTNPINVAAGTYNYTVTDANSCQQTGSVTVTQPAAAFTVTATHTDVNCFGASTGTITLTETGGTTPYGAVTWSGGLSGTNPINVAAGTYNYTVTDANSCQQTGSVTVTQPASAFTVTAAHTNVNCFGASTGTITLTETGGTTPYGTVTWSGGLSGTNPINVAAGTYNYTVTDANSCQQTGSVTVTQPASAFTVTAAHTNVNCFGASTGTITLTETGGTTPYGAVTWSGGLSGTNPINVAAGTYNYTVTDANSCQQTGSVTVTQPAAAFTVTATHTDVNCFGASSGTITLTEAGGTTPYGAVTWSGGLSGTNPINVAAGTYNYTVSDANSCQQTGSVTVTQPAAAFTVTAAHTDVRCKGVPTGTITLTEAGGTTPYGAVTWSGGLSGTNPINVAAGTYNYTVTDANSCQQTGSVTVTQPASAFTVTAAHTNVNCFGAATGTITLTETGGTTPYSAVTWSGGLSGTNPINVAAGTYNYTVTDANSCQQTGSVTVTQPAAAFSVTATHTDVNCFGAATGTITLTETGGTTPYGAVTWSGGLSGTNPINVAAGTYNYTVSDANSCQQTGSVTVTQPAAAFTVTAAHTDVRCKGVPTGTITLTEAGGTTPYGAVTWSGGLSGTNPINVPAGTYNYTVTDANSCQQTGTVTVAEPANVFAVTSTHVDVTCYGASTGSLTLSQSGGSPAYAAPRWLDGPTGTTRSNLPVGTYYFADSDSHGCLVIDSVTILGPANGFIVTATHTDVQCFGGATGTITLTETGGTTPYTAVTWTGGLSGTSPTNVPAGSYTYSVSDAGGCQQTATVTVTQPAAAFSVTAAHTDVLCRGGSSGTITLTEAGGTTPYGAVTWSGGLSGTNPINVAAGTYNYTVTDANSCQQTGSATVAEPASVFSVSETHVNVACFGNNTGSITLTGSGGTTPYGTAWWSDGATGNVRSNLLAGTYNYTDSDHNGCLVTGSVTITQPATGGMTITTTETDATCSYNSNGSATATVSGGVSPYGFSWSGGFTQNDPSTSTNSNLAPAAYTVTVTDANGCTASGATTVNAPARITAQLAVTNVTCFGGINGSVTVTSGGGTGTIGYTWSANAGSPGNSPTASNLAAGTYQVTLTDANGCQLDTFATVGQPASALTFATPVFVKNVSCNGGSDGEIRYTVSGGTGPYAYTWSGSAAGSGNDATNLAAASYDVTITDANGCSVTNTQVVTEPTAVTITTQSQTNVTCNGNTDGTATLTASGGTPGGVYTYVWSPSVSSGNTATGLAAGLYTVVVSDNNSCTVQTTFTITAPPAISASLAPVNVLCHGDNNGSITVTASGGTPAIAGYVYTWTPNVSTTNTAGNLTAGSYSVVVSDSLGCNVTRSATITEPAALVLTAASVVSVSCSRDSNGQITFAASGGTPGYQYAISPDGVTFSSPNGSGVFTDLKIGTYTGQVTDANGCTSTATATITAPDSVTVAIKIDTVKCYGENNGALTVTSTGGTPGYTYDFSGGISNTTGIDQGLVAGNYGVTVTDSRGCAQTYQVAVPQPDSLQITITPEHPTVNLGETTVIQASSNSPYEVIYNWSPAEGLSNTTGSNVSVTTNNSMLYSVTAYINPHGEHCTVNLQVPVTVTPIYNVYVPNAFTPNDDGINDVFEIYGNKKTFKFVEVSVFDRWGERVFFSNDVNFQWDGIYNGAKLEPGTFVYQISIVFIDEHAQPDYKGSLLLIR